MLHSHLSYCERKKTWNTRSFSRAPEMPQHFQTIHSPRTYFPGPWGRCGGKRGRVHCVATGACLKTQGTPTLGVALFCPRTLPHWPLCLIKGSIEGWGSSRVIYPRHSQGTTLKRGGQSTTSKPANFPFLPSFF